jgi:hypothetical protein
LVDLVEGRGIVRPLEELLRRTIALSERFDEAIQVTGDALQRLARLTEVVLEEVTENPIAAAAKEAPTQPANRFPHRPAIVERL